MVDSGNERFQVFNHTGEYRAQITRADLQALEHRTIKPPNAIAVDASGNLWITEEGDAVYEFPPGGVPSGRVVFSELLENGEEGKGIGEEPAIAIDASGDLYRGDGIDLVKSRSSANVNVLGTLRGERNACDCSTAAAVDPANQDVYLDEGRSVAHFPASNTSGNVEASDTFGLLGPGALGASSGIAVEGTTGAVYVSDAAAERVDIFIPATLAGATVEAPTEVMKTGALLHGAVNPAGTDVTACQFEYGSERCVFPHAVPCSPESRPLNRCHGQLPGRRFGRSALWRQANTYYYRLAATTRRGPITASKKKSRSRRRPR